MRLPRFTHFATLITLCGCLLANCASAKDLFVDNRFGNDLNNGRSPAVLSPGVGPFRTITRALRAADKGDRVVLAKSTEPYRESITLQAGRHSGFPERPFELVGNGAILDGTARIPDDAWEHYKGDVFRFRPSHMQFNLLYRGGRPLVRVEAPPGTKKIPDLDVLQFCLIDGFAYFRVERGNLPHAYNLSNTRLRVGITLYESRNVRVTDLTVQGFSLDGINAHDGVKGALFQGVVSRGNGRSGISVGGASHVRLERCTAGDNGSAQVRTEGFSQTHIDNCRILENTAPGIDRRSGEVFVTNRPNELPRRRE